MNNLTIIFPGQQQPTEAMKERAKEQIQIIEETLENETIKSAKIVVKKRNKEVTKVELTVTTDKNLYRREDSGKDYYEALTKVVNQTESAIYRAREKRKERSVSRRRNNKKQVIENYQKDSMRDLNIYRTKKVELKDLLPDQAVDEMINVGHNFYLFVNLENGSPSVIYQRKDGGYGIIEGI